MWWKRNVGVAPFLRIKATCLGIKVLSGFDFGMLDEIFALEDIANMLEFEF